MTIELFTGGLWTPYLPPLTPGAAFANMGIYSATDKIAFIVTVPRGGILNSFEYLCGANSTIPGSVVRFSFQSLDSDGLPDGVIDQFALRNSADGDADFWSSAVYLTDDGTGGGTPRTVVKGERLACVIDFDTYVGTDYFEIKYLQTSGEGLSAPNAVWQYVGAWTEVLTALPIFDLSYLFESGVDNIVFMPGCYPIWLTSYYDYLSGDGEIGLNFSLPAPMLLGGVSLRLSSLGAAYPGPCVLKLYDSDGATVLETVAMPYVLSERYYTVTFTQNHLMAANEFYWITVASTDAAIPIQIYSFSYPQVTFSKAFEGGFEFALGFRAAGSPTWSGPEDAFVRPWVSLLIVGIDHSTGVVESTLDGT